MVSLYVYCGDRRPVVRVGHAGGWGLLLTRASAEGSLFGGFIALQLDPEGHWRKSTQTANPAVPAMTAPASRTPGRP